LVLTIFSTSCATFVFQSSFALKAKAHRSIAAAGSVPTHTSAISDETGIVSLSTLESPPPTRLWPQVGANLLLGQPPSEIGELCFLVSIGQGLQAVFENVFG
jgi:hypothetical protein